MSCCGAAGQKDRRVPPRAPFPPIVAPERHANGSGKSSWRGFNEPPGPWLNFRWGAPVHQIGRHIIDCLSVGLALIEGNIIKVNMDTLQTNSRINR